VLVSSQLRSSFGSESGPLHYAHLSHYTAAYRDEGEGPPIVLVHGLAGGMGLLAPLARALTRTHRVIRYQLRGEDDCFALRRRFGLLELAEDLAEFLDLLRLERPAVLGVSFGGALALDFAARFPDRLSALAVQGAGAFFQRGTLQRVAGWVLARYPLPDDSPFVNQFFNLLFGRKQVPGPTFDFVTRQCWRTDQAMMAHRFRLVHRLNLTRRLGRVKVPALVVGAGRDPLVPAASLKALCAGLPGCHRVDLPQAGHLAFVTEAERVAAETSAFLAGVNNPV
jgi:pimeloyl-ACP methyl ester carboxylesterase